MIQLTAASRGLDPRVRGRVLEDLELVVYGHTIVAIQQGLAQRAAAEPERLFRPLGSEAARERTRDGLGVGSMGI
jgi:hypothetical protein